MTFERQAFEATMTISNAITDLTNVNVVVYSAEQGFRNNY
jgi:hypothetical protein